MEIDYDVRTKVKAIMLNQGLSPNSRVIEIKCNQAVLQLNHIERLCETFGATQKIEQKENSYIVSYIHASEAMIAKLTISQIAPEDIGCEISVDFTQNEEIVRTFEIVETPKVFVPTPCRTLAMKSEPPETLKYIARFPISIQDSEGFHLTEKLLGAKSCNFRKIVEICAKDFVIPNKPKDLIKLLIVREPEFMIKLTSRYCSKFTTACELVYELITVVMEEYKRYCEIQGQTPPDTRVRKLEQIKGRSRIFKERKENPRIYSIIG